MLTETLTKDDIVFCIKAGNETYNLFKNNEGFYRNLLSSHIIGKYGEVAVDRFLRNKLPPDVGVTPYFKDAKLLQLCDIGLHGEKDLRIEVKTWRFEYWNSWGRCVTPGKMPKLISQADLVIWAYIARPITSIDLELPGPENIEIVLTGYSTIEDIQRSPTRFTGPEGKQIFNHQLDIDTLRKMDDFIAEVIPKLHES